MKTSMTIRPMRREDLGRTLDWAAQEGWNPGLNDLESFWAADPGGYWLGEVDGQPVATLSTVRSGPGHGFVGLYIVAPAWRAKGLGWQLWQHGMAQMGARRLGLDGVVARQDDYRRSGFALAWHNARFEGMAPVGAHMPATVRPLSAWPWAQAMALDGWQHPAAPEHRQPYWRACLNQTASRALGVGSPTQLQGLGVLRPARQGWRIGPVLAEGPAQAEALLQGLLSLVPAGQRVQIDVPLSQPHAVALVRSMGWTQVFDTARMYRGGAIEGPPHTLYGIASLELG